MDNNKLLALVLMCLNKSGGGGGGGGGADGVGIVSITFARVDASGGNVYTVLLTDGTSYEITAPMGATGPQGATGATGEDGVGISSITFARTDANGGNVYTVLLSDGSSYEITAPKGAAGSSESAKATRYYATLNDAVSDINSYFSEGTDVESGGTVRVDVLPDGLINVTLLANQTVAETLCPKTSLTIELAGFTITSTAAILISVQTTNSLSITIDGRESGSRISVVNSAESQVHVAQLLYDGKESSHFYLLGGNVSISGSQAVTCAVRAVGFDVHIDGCEIEVSSNSATASPGILGIWLQNNGRAYLKNSIIDVAYSGTGDGTTFGIYNQLGSVVADTCEVIVDAPYEVNNKCYATAAMGNLAGSTATLKNCTMTGLMVAISNSGELFIDGGIYQAKGHGGIYASGASVTRVRGAILREGDYEGSAQIPNPSFNQAAMYIGGTALDHPVVYLDNCTLSASSTSQFLAIRNATSARLYISNTNIPTGKFIRVDQIEEGTNLILVGEGCNIDEDSICIRTGGYESGGVWYNEITVAHDGIYTPTATEILTIDEQAVEEHLLLTHSNYSALDPTVKDLHDFKIDIQSKLEQKIAAPTNPSAGQFLKFNGSAWVASSLPVYDGSVI